MAEIVAFPTDIAAFSQADTIEQMAEDRFLLEEGLDFLADFRSIPDPDVRASLRALVRSMARQSNRLTS